MANRTKKRTPPGAAALAARVRVVLSTAPARVAAELARALVRGRHATCVNVVPGATSVYRWKGRVESSRESILVIKTSGDRVKALLAMLEATHPYEVPEAVVLRPVLGLPKYLAWLLHPDDGVRHNP